MLPLHHDPRCSGEPAVIRLIQNISSFPFTSSGVAQSGWPDSNRRSPAPKAGGLPGFPTSRHNRVPTIRAAGFEPAFSSSPSLRIARLSHALLRSFESSSSSSPCGSRTHLSALKGRNPADRRTSQDFAFHCEWAGGRSNPRLRCFRPLLDRLSYRPVTLVPSP